jgi:hypothetical protein
LRAVRNGPSRAPSESRTIASQPSAIAANAPIGRRLIATMNEIVATNLTRASAR